MSYLSRKNGSMAEVALSNMKIVPCHNCGCTGIHACLGQPSVPLTQQEIHDQAARFTKAIERVQELRSMD